MHEGGLNHVKNLILGFSLNQEEPNGSDRDYQNKTQTHSKTSVVSRIELASQEEASSLLALVLCRIFHL